MKCLNCNYELENDDNFCPNCGHWSARGYIFFNNSDNVNMVLGGSDIRQTSKLITLFIIISISLILFTIMLLVKGNSIFKPIIVLKKEINSYKYGYNVSIMETNHIYHNKNIENIDDAKKIINYDFNSQTWKCMHDIDTYKIEREIEEQYNIVNVNFCDIDYMEVIKIKNVIDKIYSLFPTLNGTLTNITISNLDNTSEYIAYFQPMFQFVNFNGDINKYNKVNKTQILLNSFYFLNNKILNSEITDYVSEDWYVQDATWESVIAHEFGHFISFSAFLHDNSLDNIIFVDINNEEKIQKLMEEYDSGLFSQQIIENALDNYNKKYFVNLNVIEFVSNISKYASIKDENNEIIFDEAIAEAVHDYYLHGDNCKKESYEIVSTLKLKL